MNDSVSPGFNNLVLGTDLVKVSRLEKAFSRYGQAFFAKMLTQAELEYCFDAVQKEAVSIYRVAGRVALKEAVAKALGTGLNGLGWGEGVFWHDIEILAQLKCPPQLKLYGKAQHVADKLRVGAWRISLSHDGCYAIGTVVGLVHP